MRSWNTWLGLIASVWVLSGCGPKIKPGLGVEVWVEGNRAGLRATSVTISFDRSMVPDRDLGKTHEKSSSSPFRISPDVPGALVWREDRLLSFEPSNPLPRATHFTVTIPKGTAAPDHFGLDKDFEFTFDTERLRLATELVESEHLPPPAKFAIPEQHLRLRFNQPVRTAELVKACHFVAETGQVTLPLKIDPAPEADPTNAFSIAPATPLALDSAWHFRCDPGLAPAEGPLPIESSSEPHEEDGREPEGSIAFRTFGPFRALAVHPSGTEVDPDETTISVEFSTPPASPDGSNPITITPAPLGVAKYATSGPQSLFVNVSGLASHTEYTVSVPGGLKDVFGQVLSAPFSDKFRTGVVRPGFALETGSWAIESNRSGYVAWTRNVNDVEVRAASLNETQLSRLLPLMNWWDREAVDLGKLQIPATTKHLTPSDRPDQWNQLLLDPKQLLGQTAGGRFFYIATRAKGVQHPYDTDEQGHPLEQGYLEVLLNVTNLGVTSKLSTNSGLIWVTQLSDGKPVKDAEVTVRDENGTVLWRGTTDEHGVATTPGRVELTRTVPTPDDREREFHGDNVRLLVFARQGDDVSFVDPSNSGSFAAWNFGVPTSYDSAESALRGFLHTDRGLYRPGDTVHLRGLVRSLKLRGGLVVPGEAEASIVITDPRGSRVLERKVPLSRFGGFNFDHTVSDHAPLGDYTVVADFADGQFSETFSVEEFRASTFEVKLSSEQKAVFAGDSVTLSALGNYFYGAPVRAGKVTFDVHSRRRPIAFEGFDRFEFGDTAGRDGYEDPYGEEPFVSEASATLDAHGKSSARIVLPNEQFTGPSTLLLSATVQDETNQSVTANLTLPLHKTHLYLGLDTGGWTAASDAPTSVRLVAVNPEGRLASANATLEVTRTRWSCAWEAWGFLGSYRCTDNHERVLSEAVALAAAPAERSIRFPGPGEYSVELRAKDAQGNDVKASRSVWVWGDGESSWRVDDSKRFKMTLDKKEYRVGETARLILQTPVKGASALISVERDGVLSQRFEQELQEGRAVEIPITADMVPNAYASVMLARGRMGDNARGLPKTTMGLVDIPVVSGDKHLKVNVEPDRPDYRPGEPVTAKLHVSDAAGKPVLAEVALSAADEGVLSLIDFKTPDPFTTFYAPWALGVVTTSQYERLAQVPAPGEERYVTGGDSAGLPGTFRSRFRSTAYWNPAVTTDADGNATVTFAAPDNLTAFRLMAVAADATDRFGSSDRRFQVNKPVQLISALPRFASVGDHFEAAVMVTNDTPQAGSGKLRFWALGALAPAGAPPNSPPQEQDVTVPAGGRVRVAFPVNTTVPGTATLRFAVTLAGQNDGLEVSLPVHYPTSEEHKAISAGFTEKSVKLPVLLPEGTLADSAQLEIAVDPDGLAGIEDTLRDLVQYPYGCLEQTTSRLIPLVAIRELTQNAQLSDLNLEQVKQYIEIALAKIYRHQTPSGGFSLWPGTEPSTYLTAYALWGLELAEEAGYEPDHEAVSRGAAYLKMELSNEPPSGRGLDLGGELASRAFAVYVLSLMNDAESGFATALLSKADAMPTYGQAFLARALGSLVGTAHASVNGLVNRWQPRPGASLGSAMIEEPNNASLYWYWSSNVRTTAVVMDTLLALRPDDPRIPRLVHGLLDARRSEGSWETTQENLYALVALSHYAKARSGSASKVEIRRGQDLVFADRMSGQGLERIRHVRIPVQPGDERPLSFSASEGPVHYRVLLRYRRDSAHQPAESEGLTISHVFEDPDTGKPLTQLNEGQVVRVKVKLGSPAERTRVAVSDFLPAGLEPVNTRFDTVPQDIERDDPNWLDDLWLSYRDLKDERVDAFVDWLWAREGNFDYLARATTVGDFVVPAAKAEMMYDPDVHARTELTHIKVVPHH
ncbi:MAG TPA: MG2 domain-containing protein [Polyangiaceae bacterium]|nr:MG2 domain-containing protein [Polyangiaceae bacterium]